MLTLLGSTTSWPVRADFKRISYLLTSDFIEVWVYTWKRRAKPLGDTSLLYSRQKLWHMARRSLQPHKSFQSIKSIMLCSSVQSSGGGSRSASQSLKVRHGPYEIHNSSPASMSRRVMYVTRRFLRSRSQPTF